MESATFSKSAASPQSKQPSTETGLPNEPLVVIKPGKSWVALNLRDVWVYRELLYFLIWRELKIRYKQTVLGVLWVILQPVLITLIFTVFLGGLARVPSDRVPYPLFAYSGIVAWTFISNSILNCGSSLVGNANLITKIYFPRMLVPAASIGGRLVDFGIALILLGMLMAYYRVFPTRAILMLPVVIVIMTLFSLGVGLWMAALNVKYRDIGIILPVVIQLWMFVSPIVYPISLIPPKWRSLYALNPLVGIIQGFRASLLNLGFDWWALGIAAVCSTILLVSAAFAFSRMQRGFADLI
ncbi:MAG: lipopolysaccharide transport system permease protein [Blastocatellia bacterium]|jgi:lipopolysaccharide transport system permease protein|nr:lipopolysaccharide transport system permease protein [Blastocatellia bacterium]